MTQLAEPWFMREGAPLHLTWSRLWKEVLENHAERTALVLKEVSLSYQQLDQKAQGLANALRGRHIQPYWSIVAVSTERADFLKAFIALWSLDCTVVPYSRRMLDQDHALMRLMDSLVDFWLDSNDVLSETARGGGESSQMSRFNLEQPPHAVYFTSGTSGKSKGVLRGWRQAIFEAGHYALTMEMEPGLFNAMLIDPTFGASTKQILASLLMGCAQGFPYLEHGPGEVSGGHILYGTPSHFRGEILPRISQDAKFQWVSLTGESPSAKSLRCASKYLLPNGRILNALGGTEFGVASNHIIEPVELEVTNASANRSLLPHKHSLILDDNGAPLPQFSLGRLAIESHYLAEGYLAMGEHEILCFAPFPTMPDGQRRFVTGDIASLDRHGGIQLQGRSNRMMKLHGQWVDTSPLEGLLDAFGEIDDYVLDRDELNGGLRVWLVPAVGLDESVLSHTLGSLVHELVGPMAVFRGLNYVRVDEIPRNRNGKVDYQALDLMSFEVISVGNTSFFDPILSYLLDGVCPSGEALIQNSLSALGMTSIELLDLANQFAKARQIPPDVSLFLADMPLAELRERLWKKYGSRHWPLDLGNCDRSYCLLWFGFGGINEVLKSFGAQSRVLYWDCDWSLTAKHALNEASIERLVSDQLRSVWDMLRGVDSILVGGFSFGALMALEAGHQLEKQGLPVDRLVLLDPSFQGGLKTNRCFRFLANRVAKVLHSLLERHRFSEKTSQDLRRSLRRTVISRFKANPVRAFSFIQTTQKRRLKATQSLGGACLNPDWVHEPTNNHFEILSEPRFKIRWLKVIDDWSRRSERIA